MKFLPLFLALALPFLASAQVIALTESPSERSFSLNVDDILIVRSHAAGGSVITYGPSQTRVFVEEHIDSVAVHSCDKLLSFTITETQSGRDVTSTILVGVPQVLQVRENTAGKAVITLRGTRSTLRTDDDYADVVAALAACLGGASGGASTVTSAAPISGDGSGGDPLTIGTGAINATHLANNSVNTAELVDAAVTNGKMANRPAFTMMGNNTGSLAATLDLTVAQIQALISVDDLIAQTGRPEGSTDLGTGFTGTTIPDGSDMVEALQSLETALEAVPVGGTIGGSIASTQIPVGTGANTVGGSASLTHSGAGTTGGTLYTRGANTSAGTRALSIQNSSPSDLMYVENNSDVYLARINLGRVMLGTSQQISILPTDDATAQSGVHITGFMGANKPFVIGTTINNNHVHLRPHGTGGVGVGVTTFAQAASALLQVDATTKGFLPPRMTTAQRVAISSPAQGLIVHDTDTDAEHVYDGAGWREHAKVLKGSATLDFGSTAANTVTDLTVTVTGAADGDPVMVGSPNGSTVAGGNFTAWVSAADTVTVRFSNNTAGPLDPTSGTFKVTVNK